MVCARRTAQGIIITIFSPEVRAQTAQIWRGGPSQIKGPTSGVLCALILTILTVERSTTRYIVSNQRNIGEYLPFIWNGGKRE